VTLSLLVINEILIDLDDDAHACQRIIVLTLNFK
jgi:hypothetical protein